jgi:hypothetical protein
MRVFSSHLACNWTPFAAYILRVPPKKKTDTTPRQYSVGDRVTVCLHTGRLVDATIRAIVERTEGLRTPLTRWSLRCWVPRRSLLGVIIAATYAPRSRYKARTL